MSAFRGPIHAGFVLVTLSAMFIAGCGHRAARVNAPLAPARIGSTETGIASWYGVPYDGRRAASGEIYDMRQRTAAHRQLPFQTWVEVTNLSNGKQVEVRINDRGPFVKGRILDLSQAAARDIDMLRAGTARVRVKVILRPSPVPGTPPNTPPREPVELAAAHAAPGATPVPVPSTTMPLVTTPTVTPLTVPPPAAPAATTPFPKATHTPSYAVQAGAFSNSGRAESLRSVLAELFGEARVAPLNRRTPPLWRVIVGRDMAPEQAAELAIRVRHETGSAIVVPEPESSSRAAPSTAPDSTPYN